MSWAVSITPDSIAANTALLRSQLRTEALERERQLGALAQQFVQLNDNIKALTQRFDSHAGKIDDLLASHEQLSTAKNACPRLFVIVPKELHHRTAIERFREKLQVGWLNEKCLLRLVCDHSLLPVKCGPDGEGFEITRPRKWVRDNEKAVRLCLKLLKGVLDTAQEAVDGLPSLPLPTVAVLSGAAQAVLNLDDSVSENNQASGESEKFGPLRKFLTEQVLENQANMLARKNLLGLRPCMVKTTKGGDTAFRTYWVSYANYASFKESVERDRKNKVVNVPKVDTGDKSLFALAQEKTRLEVNDAGSVQGAQTTNLTPAVHVKDAGPAHAQTPHSQGDEGRRCAIM